IPSKVHLVPSSRGRSRSPDRSGRSSSGDFDFTFFLLFLPAAHDQEDGGRHQYDDDAQRGAGDDKRRQSCRWLRYWIQGEVDRLRLSVHHDDPGLVARKVTGRTRIDRVLPWREGLVVRPLAIRRDRVLSSAVRINVDRGAGDRGISGGASYRARNPSSSGD